MQTGNTNDLCKNDLDKTYFRHDLVYRKDKDLVQGKELDKVSKDKAFKIASNPKYDGYERGLASMLYKFLIKLLKVVALNICQIGNLQIKFIKKLLETLKDWKSIIL